MKMNQNVKKLWVNALRSGEYEQGTQQLCSGDGRFCCLGVLTDLGVKAGVLSKPVFEIRAGKEVAVYTNAKRGRSWENLPPDIQSWSELESRDGWLTSPVETLFSLVELNDSGNYSFGQIADIIEDQF